MADKKDVKSKSADPVLPKGMPLPPFASKPRRRKVIYEDYVSIDGEKDSDDDDKQLSVSSALSAKTILQKSGGNRKLIHDHIIKLIGSNSLNQQRIGYSGKRYYGYRAPGISGWNLWGATQAGNAVNLLSIPVLSTSTYENASRVGLAIRVKRIHIRAIATIFRGPTYVGSTVPSNAAIGSVDYYPVFHIGMIRYPVTIGTTGFEMCLYSSVNGDGSGPLAINIQTPLWIPDQSGGYRQFINTIYNNPATPRSMAFVHNMKTWKPFEGVEKQIALSPAAAPAASLAVFQNSEQTFEWNYIPKRDLLVTYATDTTNLPVLNACMINNFSNLTNTIASNLNLNFSLGYHWSVDFEDADDV